MGWLRKLWMVPVLFLAGFGMLAVSQEGGKKGPDDPVVLVVHGGAGVEDRDKMTKELEEEYRAALTDALKKGHGVLTKSGSSLDAIEAAINVLEDLPCYNAGRGAVFNRDGRNELNASIMDGATRKAGAVAGVDKIKNPISAARAVMEKSDHVFLIGEGAERFARDKGLTMVSPLYFWTERSWKQMKDAEAKAKEKASAQAEAPYDHFGTVGAVALDSKGNLAAGTSTGGINYKLPGRVGDSPIIGAGTFAENATCGVSCTGHGEFFIRWNIAADVAARMRYKGDTLSKAAEGTIGNLPKKDGGLGGFIALDRHGNAALVYDTNGMYRGSITQSGKMFVAIYQK